MANSETKLCAIIGHPVKHSMSPAMHNAMYESLGLNYCYLAFDVLPENLGNAIESMRSLGIRGYSVTVPHKINAMKHVDWIEPLAEKIGAINTIVNDSGVLKGYNTDFFGAIEALKEKTGLKGKKVLMIGAGGAARAIAFGLSSEGSALTISNRTGEKAAELAKEVSAECLAFSRIQSELKNFDVLVNATSVGMNPDSNNSVISIENANGLVLFDIVYNPIETRLLKEAKANACSTINGVKMLVFQGAKQFELFTGKAPSIKLMEEIVLKRLARK
ncbi:MAG: shikimate dehydrogenase [Candidatus Diapherotrites archaeon]|uniref:Shikimate dehydrogenase (NADP(+)) n=2 Tax=Candidatus Iainarchaeum sp. TaxID=3101447 RepID=A0A8T4L660_9ARCH|nr:shikimate dehydrogenase [Candidatus Diapherotrites archaeon]